MEEVEGLAMDTMKAVSQAEQQAQERVLQAKKEADQIRHAAAEQGEQLCAAAIKEARKRAEVLYGVAKADGEKRKETILEESRQEQEQLRDLAQKRQAQVVKALEKIVLGLGR